MVVTEPTILATPALLLLGIVRRVRGPLKGGGTPLPFMTDGATEDRHLVRAKRTDEQVEARMRAERLRQSSADANRKGLTPVDITQQKRYASSMDSTLSWFTIQQDVANRESWWSLLCVPSAQAATAAGDSGSTRRTVTCFGSIRPSLASSNPYVCAELARPRRLIGLGIRFASSGSGRRSGVCQLQHDLPGLLRRAARRRIRGPFGRSPDDRLCSDQSGERSRSCRWASSGFRVQRFSIFSGELNASSTGISSHFLPRNGGRLVK